tara:strand:- start:879 stop:1364 length:486 start_codon:yes stop_codon:yes gene_type:complete
MSSSAPAVQKIQDFQVSFMEIIEDIADEIPNNKYVDICNELKDNYNQFEEIQDKIKAIEEQFLEMQGERNFYGIFSYTTKTFMQRLNIHDIFAEGLEKTTKGEDWNIDINEVRQRIKSVRCNNEDCNCCDEIDDYEERYNKLVDRVKNTSKSQLQILKNEL